MRLVRLAGVAHLRRRIGGTIAVALLVGLAGGAVLTAAAGARRTESAYGRLTRATSAADARVGPQGFGVIDPAVVGGLPNVKRVAALDGFGMGDRPKVGLVPPNNDFADVFAAASADGVAGYRMDRMFALDGRMPRPQRADEVIVNEVFAREKGLGVGDTYHAVVFNFAALQQLGTVLDADGGRAPTDAEAAALFVPVTLRITGVGQFRSDLITDENSASPGMLLTPAFARAHPDQVSYGSAFVTLRHPATDVAGLGAAARQAFPDQSVDVQTLDADVRTFQRTVTPYAEALWLFALVAFLTGLLVVGQSLLRMVTADSADGPSLGALGATRAQRARVAAFRAALVVVGGAGLALVIAIAASPLFPLGRAADAEPSPGLSVDVVALGVGTLVLVAGFALVVGATAWWRAGATVTADAGWHPSSTAERLAGRGAGATAVCGVRFALQRRPGPEGLALGTTVFGLVAAIAALGAALVFATNLDHLVATPAQYGWHWDALIDAFDVGIQPDLHAQAVGDHDLTALTEGTRATVVLGGRTVPAFGFERVRGPQLPEVTAGRWPTRPDEVALGAQTLRGLHASVGDRVPVTTPDGRRAELRIVGRTILPSLTLNGTYGIGEGVALTSKGLARLDPSSQPSFFLADVRDGANIAKVARRYDASSSLIQTKQPGDVGVYAQVRTTPLLLAGMLGLLGVGVLVHLLVTSIRQRRRDLAILKTLGFSRRQVSAAVAWQATTLVSLAVVVGVPSAVVLGGWVWRRFAQGLGVATDIVLPVVGLGAIVAVALVLANLIAVGPARAAARTRPAAVLRSE